MCISSWIFLLQINFSYIWLIYSIYLLLILKISLTQLIQIHKHLQLTNKLDTIPYFWRMFCYLFFWLGCDRWWWLLFLIFFSYILGNGLIIICFVLVYDLLCSTGFDAQAYQERIKKLKAKMTARNERITLIIQRGTPDSDPLKIE